MCGKPSSVFFDDARRHAVLKGIFDSYYSTSHRHDVVFDTNQIWTARMPLLNQLFPTAQVICCVRDIGWIINSTEQMLINNPLELSRMFNFEAKNSVYSRASQMMAENGVIGRAINALREAWFGPYAQQLIIVPYEQLTQKPETALKALYHSIGEPWFEHDFNNIAYDAPEYDKQLGMPGMHRVKPQLTPNKKTPCIPPDLFEKYASSHFWQDNALIRSGIKILRPTAD
jgi:sulfotransferase